MEAKKKAITAFRVNGIELSVNDMIDNIDYTLEMLKDLDFKYEKTEENVTNTLGDEIGDVILEEIIKLKNIEISYVDHRLFTVTFTDNEDNHDLEIVENTGEVINAIDRISINRMIYSSNLNRPADEYIYTSSQYESSAVRVYTRMDYRNFETGMLLDKLKFTHWWRMPRN